MLIILSGSISGVNHGANQNTPISTRCTWGCAVVNLSLILKGYFRSKEMVSQGNAIRTVLDIGVQDIVALSRQRRGLQLLAL
jgi:hypothetical protein